MNSQSNLFDHTSDIQQTIITLTQNLLEYNYHYHTLNQSLISDSEYDQLFQQLVQLEIQYPEYKQVNSPTYKIGATPSKQFIQYPHTIPMLSLNNIFSNLQEIDINIRHHDLLQFHKRIIDLTGYDSISYLATPKYDGVAISLLYEYGILIRALTRGDGFMGEDITANVKTIKTIPSVLNGTIVPKLLEIRGEVIIFTQDFIELNQQQIKLQQKTFSNPRNTASGSLRQLDSSVTKTRRLRFCAYAIAQNSNEIQWTTFLEQLHYLEQLGFNISKNLLKICSTTDELIAFYTHIGQQRLQLPFGIDGVVYKVNQLDIQQQLGYLLRAPRFAIAHKFPAPEVSAQIIDIQVQVGRTGAITPVAKITPTAVGGVVVSSISLYNFENIKRKDIRIGDFVLIRRAGDVIPEIVNVELHKRQDTQIFTQPTICPICKSTLIQLPDEIVIRCSGSLYCSAQMQQHLMHFTSRLAFNIDGLGEKIIEQLINAGFIKNSADIFRLTKAQFMTIERGGEKSATNLINAINLSKTTTLAKFIYALGIRHVGERTAQDLAKHFSTIENFMAGSLNELLQIHGIGVIVAQSIMQFIQQQHNIEVIQQLLELGVTYVTVTSPIIFHSAIRDKTFVITGSIAGYSRDAIKTMITNGGGITRDNISKKTDYLIVGDNPGSSLAKATQLDIPILTWQDFNYLLTTQFIYLHGFASSPNSSKAQYFKQKFYANQLIIPDLNLPHFQDLTLSRQIAQVGLLINQQQNVILFGSSMGGLTALLLAEQYPNITHLVLFAPAFSMPQLWEQKTNSAELKQWQSTNEIVVNHYGYNNPSCTLKYTFYADLMKHNTVTFQRQLPVLIFHGVNDDIVPINLSRTYCQSHPSAQLCELDDDHGLGKNWDFMWQQVQKFLSRDS